MEIYNRAIQLVKKEELIRSYVDHNLTDRSPDMGEYLTAINLLRHKVAFAIEAAELMRHNTLILVVSNGVDNQTYKAHLIKGLINPIPVADIPDPIDPKDGTISFYVGTQVVTVPIDSILSAKVDQFG